MKVNKIILKSIFCIIIFVCIINLCGNVKATEDIESGNESGENSIESQNTTTDENNNESNNNNQDTEDDTNSAEEFPPEYEDNNQEIPQETDSIPIPPDEPQDNEPQDNEPQKTNPVKTGKKSSNANLKMLGITPNDFKGFKSTTTSYDVTVPNDVSLIKVYASTQDPKATISGVGNQNLSVGKNVLNIIVEAEDGTEKIYTINVIREEDTSINETNSLELNTTTSETSSNKDLAKLEVEGYTLTPKFSPDTYEYKLDVPNDVTDLNIIAKGTDDNVKIEIAGNKSLIEGENTVTILVYNDETKENSTYQITVNKLAINELNQQEVNPTIQKTKRIRIILIGGISLVIIGIIAFLIIKRRQLYSEQSTDDLYEYDMEDQDKINLDNEEELFSRVNREKLTKISKEPETNKENEMGKSKKIELLKEKMNEKENKIEYFRTSNSKQGEHFDE